MFRTIKFDLNQFATIPRRLRVAKNTNVAADTTLVHIPSLMHHLYLDTYGIPAPIANPLLGLYSNFLSASSDFRWRTTLGSHKEARIGENNKIGKAFARWFLSTHLQIRYFAHMDNVLDRTLPPEFPGLRLTRSSRGDTPDYLCANNAYSAYLAEAKGTANSIAFTNSKFASWRRQFSRVTAFDASGVRRSLKGYLIAARVTDESHPRTWSQLLAEDPHSPGEPVNDEHDLRPIALRVIANHYASIFEKLGLMRVAAALINGWRIDDAARSGFVPLYLWKCNLPPFDHLLFVSPAHHCLRWICFADTPSFFALEKRTFRNVVHAVAQNFEMLEDIEPLRVETEPLPLFSFLEDGSVLAHPSYFEPVGRFPPEEG